MDTKLLPASPENIQLAASLLRQGEVAGLPTETVYGLAANALDPDAVARIFAAKGRPQDNPLIVHIARIEQLEQLTHPPKLARKLADAFWPGPMTMVLPRRSVIPGCVAAGLDTVGIRMPSHPVAKAVIEAAGCPLAAPSANRSGSPSPTTAAHVLADMDGRIPLILDGGNCEVGVESTVILVLEDRVRLLRPGGITLSQLESICPVEMDEGVLHQIEPGQKVASPGMKYRHYAPSAKVVLVEGSAEEFASFMEAHQGEGVFAMVSREEADVLPCPTVPFGHRGDPASQAQELFSALRACDEKGAQTVYVRISGRKGIGLAIYNRLLRAAAFQVIRL